MFLKITEFHGLGLVGPAMWIVGAGFFLAVGSIFVFLRSLLKTPEMKAAEFERLKWAGVFGILLIGTGLAASALLGRSGPLLTERYEFRAPAKSDIGRIYYQPATENLTIPLGEMIRKTGYKILKDPERLRMTRDGFIETPFVVFGEGGYVLEFEAAGTEEESTRSRLVVGFLALEKSGTVLSGGPFVYDLTPEAKKYAISLPEAPGRIGAVRIELNNAKTKTKGLTRSVMISNVLVRWAGAK